jgi:prevent-host-death family protein
MRTISFTDFRNHASGYITAVEHGETLVLLRNGRPVAEVIPFSERQPSTPSWKQPVLRLQLQGSDLSSAVLKERESDR